MEPSKPKSTLLLYGVGQGFRDDDGGARVSGQLADYLCGMGKHYDRVVAYLRAVDPNPRLRGRVSDEPIEIVLVANNRVRDLACGIQLLHRAKGADVLISLLSSARISWLIPAIQKRARCLGVYLAMDPFYFPGRLALSWIPGWDTLYLRSFKQAVRCADRVIARGAYLGEVAQRITSSEKVAVTVPIIATDTLPLYEEYRNHGDAEPASILFFNRVLIRKGVMDLVDAFVQLKQAHPSKPSVLEFAGDGEDLDAVKDYCRQRGVGDSVRFHGWIDEARQREEIWSRAAVHVLPSRYTEGVPRAVDEAVLRGVPSVATSVGGVPKEFGRGEVMLVPPENPDLLCRALEQVLWDSTIRKTLLLAASTRQRALREAIPVADQHARILKGESIANLSFCS